MHGSLRVNVCQTILRNALRGLILFLITFSAYYIVYFSISVPDRFLGTYLKIH